MKRIFVLVCPILLSFTSTVFADPVVRVNLKLVANVLEWSCTVAPKSTDQTVDLGTWNTKQLTQTGERTTATPFAIELSECSSDQVAITFSGQKEATNNQYLALNSSSTTKNIAIQILDANKTVLPLGQESSRIAIDSSGNAKLNFYANFVSTATPVTAGTAMADATFTLNYY